MGKSYEEQLILLYEDKAQEKSHFSFFKRLCVKLFCRRSPLSNGSLFFGVPGSGKSYHYNEYGQEYVYISLFHLNIQNHYTKNMRINDLVEPVLYGNHKIWCLCENLFWYAFELDNEYYAFDIRALAMEARLGDPENEIVDIVKGQRAWLLYFIERLEASLFCISVEHLVSVIHKSGSH